MNTSINLITSSLAPLIVAVIKYIHAIPYGLQTSAYELQSLESLITIF